MRRSVAVVLSCLLAVPAYAAEWIGTLPEADRRAVEQAAVDADTAWNRRDAAALAAMYTADATLAVGGGLSAQGASAVNDYFERSFARTPATLRHLTTVDRVVVLAPDLVLADTRVALDDTAAGAARRVRDFNTLTLLARREGQWKLHAVRALPAPPPSQAR